MMMDLTVTCSVDIQMCVWMHDYLYIIIYTHMHTEGGLLQCLQGTIPVLSKDSKETAFIMYT